MKTQYEESNKAMEALTQLRPEVANILGPGMRRFYNTALGKEENQWVLVIDIDNLAGNTRAQIAEIARSKGLGLKIRPLTRDH